MYLNYIKEMKKIFMLMALVLSALMVTSCKTTEKFGVDYKLTTVGDGDGNVRVEFPVGHFYMDGKASLDLLVSNDTTPVVTVTKADVLKSGDAKMMKAMETVNTFMADEVKSETEAGGSYDIMIKGVVRERLTGLAFEVEKHLTNRPDTTAGAPTRGAVANDMFQFVK